MLVQIQTMSVSDWSDAQRPRSSLLDLVDQDLRLGACEACSLSTHSVVSVRNRAALWIVVAGWC